MTTAAKHYAARKMAQIDRLLASGNADEARYLALDLLDTLRNIQRSQVRAGG